MQFFVPHAADAAQAEQIREATRAFLGEQGLPSTKRRIFRLEANDALAGDVEVGRSMPGFGEEALLILEGKDPNLLFGCSLTRGVTQGAPLIIFRETVRRVHDFDS